MANAQLDIVLRHVRKLVTPPGPREPMDWQLLERFAANHEEAAFAALVQRYGPLVLGVCRRVLRHAHDAEDAFQATFLVLARNAAAIRKQESVGSWLYGVAHRVALKAKAEAARRHVHLRIAPSSSLTEPLADLTWRELCSALDEELTRLPDKYRAPLLLCYLEGQTQDEAAARLGWARGTLKRRLERGREILRGRLLRRGLTLSAGLFATALVEHHATVPAALASAAVHAAAATTTAGITAGMLATLVESATPATYATKLKIAVGLILIMAVTGVGGGYLTLHALATKSPETSLDDVCADEQRVAPKTAPAKAKPTAPRLEPELAEKNKPEQDETEDVQPNDANLPAGGLIRLGEAAVETDGQVPLFALSPSGKIVALVRQPGLIQLWDVAQQVGVRKISLPEGQATALAFRGDDRWLAAVVADRRIVVWDTGTGKIAKDHKLYTIRVVNGVKVDYSERIVVRTFSADGKLLAFADPDDALIHVVAVDSGKKVVIINHNRAKQPSVVVRALAFSPDGKAIAAVVQEPVRAGKQRVTVWDVSTAKLRHDNESLHVSSLAFSGDGKTLAAAIPDGGVRLWDAGTGKDIGYLFPLEAKEHAAVVDLIAKLGSEHYDDREAATKELNRFGVVVEPLLRHALTKTNDPEIRGRIQAILRSFRKTMLVERGVESVAISPDGKSFAFVDARGMVRLSDRKGKPGPELFKGGGVDSVRFSPDGKLVAGVNRDGLLRLWDAKSGKLAQDIRIRAESRPSPKSGLYALAFAPDGKTLAASATDKTLRLWDLATGEERCRLPSRASGLAFTADGKRLLTFGDKVWVLDTATRKRLFGFDRAIDGSPIAVALSPGGATLAVGGGDGALHLWDTDKNVEQRQLTGHPSPIKAVAFAPDGKMLATACGGTSVYLWDARTGRFVRALVEKKLHVHAVAFAPDGQTLAAGSQDGVVRIWDVARGFLIRECTGPKGDIVAVAYSPDGKTIAAGSPDGTVRLWEAATGKERHRYREHLSAVTALAFSPNGQRLASGSADRTAVVWDVVAPEPGGKAPRTRQQIKDLWDDLASDDAGKAYQAVYALAAGRSLSVPFLKARVQPIEANARRIARLIADLDDDAFAVRERATTELDKIGPLARPALSKALATKPPLEVRRRLEGLLSIIMQEQLESIISRERLRTLRALEVLERIGTPEARQVLRAMAEGTPEAWQTQEAKAALNRLPSTKR
jgi:RNA polymerase sigma factor (sigma-70 family)